MDWSFFDENNLDVLVNVPSASGKYEIIVSGNSTICAQVSIPTLPSLK